MKIYVTICSSILRRPDYRTQWRQKANKDKRIRTTLKWHTWLGREESLQYEWNGQNYTVPLFSCDNWIAPQLYCTNWMPGGLGCSQMKYQHETHPGGICFSTTPPLKTVPEKLKPLSQNLWGPWLKFQPGDLQSLQVSQGILQSLQVNARILLKLGYDLFLPNTLQFVDHYWAYHSILCSKGCWEHHSVKHK
jgi:hypothetical protein